MNETITIDKKKLGEKEFLYDVFYKQGIALLQKYCGDVWTDYNLHDPGITILEQLCYALTELHYKSTFPVEDYFFEKDHGIIFEKLGLQYPERILPNACTTINDLRRVLFDEICGIGNIWIEHHVNGIAGLYTVYVDIADQYHIDEKLKKTVCDGILNAFVKWRSLGEDIAEIIILERCMMDLYGTVEVHTMRPAWEVCGEIYAVCAEYVSNNMHYRSVKELHSAGFTLQELFDGPPLKNGIIPESDLTALKRMICISEMAAKIKNIQGVVDVYNLSLRGAGIVVDNCTAAVEGVMVKSVKLPQSDSEIHLQLVTSGHRLQSSYRHINDEARKKLVNDPKYPDYIKDVRRLYQFPQGRYHVFDDHYSIQNDFPSVYGISAGGILASESEERKAKAKQLKAYLWLFEQLIADMASSLQNMKKLFSADSSLKHTVFSNYLDNNKIPGIEELYTDPSNAASALELALANFDNFTDRRNAVLDMMLGIYGLEFGQISLNKLRKKSDTLSPSESIISNKLRYLRYAPLLAERLTKGVDCISSGRKRPEMISGLELQVLLRTGNDPEKTDPDEQMIIIEHVLLRPLMGTVPESDKFFYNCRVTAVLPCFSGRYSDSHFRTLVMQIIEKSAPAHLFVNYLWCSESQWLTIEKIYGDWCRCIKEKNIDRRDKFSMELSKFIKQNGGL